MREITVRELSDALPHIDRLVESEGEVILTRHGRPLVRMTPLGARPPVPTHADLRSAMPLLEVPSEDVVREDRERG